MELRIAVCDDESKALDEEMEMIGSLCTEKNIEFLIDKYDSPADLLDRAEKYDLAVLDIEMEEMNGIDLARGLAERNSRCLVIFVTNYPFYLDNAFDVKAIRFLGKPIDRHRLSVGIDRVIEKIESETKRIIVTRLRSKQKVELNISSVICIANSGRHTHVVSTVYGEFEAEEIFSDVKNMIEKEVNYFCQPHQSYYVNLKYVVKYNKSNVIMSYAGNKYTALMTRRRYKEFDESFFMLANKLR